MLRIIPARLPRSLLRPGSPLSRYPQEEDLHPHSGHAAVVETLEIVVVSNRRLAFDHPFQPGLLKRLPRGRCPGGQLADRPPLRITQRRLPRDVSSKTCILPSPVKRIEERRIGPFPKYSRLLLGLRHDCPIWTVDVTKPVAALSNVFTPLPLASSDHILRPRRFEAGRIEERLCASTALARAAGNDLDAAKHAQRSRDRAPRRTDAPADDED
jgi:hypothetical protein